MSHLSPTKSVFDVGSKGFHLHREYICNHIGCVVAGGWRRTAPSTIMTNSGVSEDNRIGIELRENKKQESFRGILIARVGLCSVSLGP
ncbi:hypothetical protein Tco_0133919 [Tanacetum coccineum]